MPAPRPESTRPVFRPNCPSAVDRLDQHLLALRRHLEALGHPAEAAALRTALDLTDELRREQRPRVAA